MWDKVLIAAGAALTAHQLEAWAEEGAERQLLFTMGQKVAAEVEKPFLVVGRPKGDYPCSPDATLDIDPSVLSVCPASGVVADVRDIPYDDKHFGVALVSHVLEHLFSLEDVQMAWRELWRVSDKVYVAYPRKSNIPAHLSGEHHLWVTPCTTDLFVEEREHPWRKGIVCRDGSVIMISPVAIPFASVVS